MKRAFTAMITLETFTPPDVDPDDPPMNIRTTNSERSRNAQWVV